MSSAENQFFTARQFAAALGVTPPAVLQRLRGTPATARQNVCGSEAKAWDLESLPAGLRSGLEEAMRQAEAAAVAQPGALCQ